MCEKGRYRICPNMYECARHARQNTENARDATCAITTKTAIRSVNGSDSHHEHTNEDGAGEAREQDTSRTFFCSELVAACLKRCGVLAGARDSAQFWPGSFSQHCTEALPLHPKASLLPWRGIESSGKLVSAECRSVCSPPNHLVNEKYACA